MTVAKVLLVLLLPAIIYGQGLVTGTFVGSPNTAIVIPPYTDTDYTFKALNATFVYSGNYSYSYTAYISTTNCQTSWLGGTGCITTVDSATVTGTLMPVSSGVNLQTGALASIMLTMDNDSGCTSTKLSGLNFCPWLVGSLSGSLSIGYRRSVDTNNTATVVSMSMFTPIGPLVANANGFQQQSNYRPLYVGYVFPYYKQ